MGLPEDGIGPPDWVHEVFAPTPADGELEALCSVVRRVFGDVTFSGTLGELMAGTTVELLARTVELSGPEMLAVIAACEERPEEPEESVPMIVCPDGWADDPTGVAVWLVRRAQSIGVELTATRSDSEPDMVHWRSHDGAEQLLVLDPRTTSDWWIDTDWVLHEGQP